jgi:hypothetical protein
MLVVDSSELQHEQAQSMSSGALAQALDRDTTVPDVLLVESEHSSACETETAIHSMEHDAPMMKSLCCDCFDTIIQEEPTISILKTNEGLRLLRRTKRARDELPEPEPQPQRFAADSYQTPSNYVTSINNHPPEMKQQQQRKHPLAVRRRQEQFKFSRNRNSNHQLQSRRRQRSSWLLPAEHPLKLLWDCLTILLSLVSAYNTHISIRDRQYRNKWLLSFCDAWFVLDILLNFVTQTYHQQDRLLDTYQAVWAHYLTSWFLIDVLSLLPGELLFVQPIIDRENKRNVWTKTLFRSRAVLKVSRIVRHHHLQFLSRFGKHTRVLFGWRLWRLKILKRVIKYVPKYLLFYRNMRGVVAVRLLRQVHWLTRLRRVVWATTTARRVAVDDDAGADHDDNNNSILHDDDHRQHDPDWELVGDDSCRDDDDDDDERTYIMQQHDYDYDDDNGPY